MNQQCSWLRGGAANGRNRNQLGVSALPVLVVCMMIAGGAVVGMHPASAEVSGSTCLEQTTNVTCQANDVRLGRLEVVGEPQTCEAGTSITVDLKATIESGPARYDIGLWINESGGSALDDPDGTCYRDFLDPATAVEGGSCDSVGGPYANLDGDFCGDIPADATGCANTVEAPCTDGSGGMCLFTEYFFTATVLCNDSNANGTADAGTCTSWSQNADDIVCSGVDTALQALPGAPSKCNCNPVEIVGLYAGCRTDLDCDDGFSCTTDTCVIENNVGTCFNTPVDSVCDDGNVCSVDSCDPDNPLADQVTGCAVDVTAANGFACGDPSDLECDSPDSCFEGVCVANYADAGALCGSEGDGVCDLQDTCDGAGSCDDNVAATDVVCRDDAGACDVAEYCDGSGACPADDYEPAGTLCGDAGDGLCDLQDTCNDSGACIDNVAGTDILCRDDAGECDVAEYCDGAGFCPGDGFEQAGTLCGEAGDGLCDLQDTCDGSGVCDDNVAATDVVCRGDAGECDVAEYCDGAGGCPVDGYEPAGVTCGEAGDGLCDLQDTCDGSGVCDDNVAAPDVVCRDDAGECDVAEYCDGAGACPIDDFEPSGTLCGGAGDGLCDLQDTCDGSGTCDNNVAGTDVLCREDGGECDVAEYCDGAGACPLDGYEPPGTACGDPSDTDCDNPDTCDGANSCLPNLEPADTACTDDGNQCTNDICNGDGACEHPNWEAGTPCDDGLACTSYDGTEGDPDACDGAGQCLGTPVDCSALDDQCNVGACDPADGACFADPEPRQGDPCEDGAFCTSDSGAPGEPDACADGQCVGQPVDCDEGAHCTVDSCDEENDTCVNEPNDALCADGRVCTDEYCDPFDDGAAPSGCVFTFNGIDPDPSTELNECLVICRTAGFWGTHALLIQELLDLGFGGFEICGQTLDSIWVNYAGSAVEGLCIQTRGEKSRTVTRQLIAGLQNCILTTGNMNLIDGVCAGTVLEDFMLDSGEIVNLWQYLSDSCSSARAGDELALQAVSEYTDYLDCWNNGGDLSLYDNYGCVVGQCDGIPGEYCGDLGCGDGQECVPFADSCHVLPLENADLGFFFETAGQWVDSERCRGAKDTLGDYWLNLCPGPHPACVLYQDP